MVIDNKIDDVTTVLSQHCADVGSPPPLHTQDVISRCHERCRCRKCRQLIAAAVSNGHIPSSTCVVASSAVNAHVPLQSSSEVGTTDAQAEPRFSSTPGETEDQVPSAPQIVSTPNGQVPSALQSVSTAGETKCQAPSELQSFPTPNGNVPSTPLSISNLSDTKGHVPSNSCSYTTENVSLPTIQTATESVGLICQPSSDNNAHVPSPPTCGTPQTRLRCHPLCSCDRCSQIVSSDNDVVETGPNVYCRNERGFSGELLLLTL